MAARFTNVLALASALAAFAGCTPDDTAAGTVVNPYAYDSATTDAATGDSSSSDLDGSVDIADTTGPDASEGSDADADTPDALDAAGDGTADALDLGDADSAGYAEVQYDTVQGFDLGAPSDLGKPYDPDVWQELPWQPEGPDSGATDAGGDVGVDAESDAGVDAAVDAIADAGADVAPDAAIDAGADVGPDAEPDVAPDVAAETDSTPDLDSATPDTDTDAAADTATDAQADAQADTSSDGEADAAVDTAADTAPDAAADADTSGDTSSPCGGDCDDGEPCTADTCLPSGQCSHAAQANGSLCSEGTCVQGICSRNSPSTPGQSCLSLRQSLPDAQSGVWWLDPDGPFGVWQPYAAWCDMEFQGGGWTLLIKVAGAGELGYDSPLWTSIATLHPGWPRLDAREAKLDSYWSVQFTQLNVRMSTDTAMTSLVIPLPGTSLFHLIKDDKPVATELPLSSWTQLLGGAQLQSGCIAQGLNIAPGGSSQSLYNYARVRIGVVGNAEGDCFTPDSRLGLGGAGNTCGQHATLTCGNSAGCYSGADIANLSAFGYVLAR